MLHTKLYMVQNLYILFFDKLNVYIRKYDATKYLS